MGYIRQLTQNKETGQLFFRKFDEVGITPSTNVPLDTELFLRKTFEEDVDAGISLLFRQYYVMLCSHAVRYVSSKVIAEDIVSDIFYEFQVGKRYLTITSSFRAYLFTMVRNRAFDYVRDEMKHTTSLEKADLVHAHITLSPDSITQYEDLYHDVENAINSMPLKRRQIYVMHRFEGKKYQEIAEELNLSLRTIEAHVYQGMRQIQSILKAKWL
jgi:RNA polymerase sigma-70 factor (ECF subfamily)